VIKKGAFEMWGKNVSRREFIKVASMMGAATFLPISWPSFAKAADNPRAMQFSNNAKSNFGQWSAKVNLSQGYLHPGDSIKIDVDLLLLAPFLFGLSATELKINEYILLVTSERCFDTYGWMRLPGDEKMSTLQTPTGIAIEGGNSGAISKHIGSRYRNPIDELLSVSADQVQQDEQGSTLEFSTQVLVPQDIPPGIYREFYC
jgi:hypothetical protein